MFLLQLLTKNFNDALALAQIPPTTELIQRSEIPSLMVNHYATSFQKSSYIWMGIIVKADPTATAL